MSNHNIYIKMHTNTYVYTYHIYKWLYTDFVFRRVPEASFRVRPKKTERQAPWPLALRRTSWKLRLNKGLGAMWWFFRENMEGFCVFSMLSMFFYGSRIFFYGFSMIFLCFSMFFFAMFFASYVFLIKKPCGTPGFFRLKHVDFRSTFPLSIGRTCSGFGARSLFSKTPIQRDEERRKGGDSDRSLGLYPKVPSSGVTYFYMELKQPY